MKIETAIKLLKGLGATDEIIKKAEDADFKPEEAIEAINNSTKEHYEQLLKNELTGTLKDDITKEVQGEILGKLNHNLKRHGIPLAEIEQLPLADKIIKYNEFMQAKFEKSGDKDELKKQFKTVEEENLSLKNQLSEREEYWKVENEKVKVQAQNQLIKDKFDLRFQKEFNNIPDNRLIGGKKSEGFYLAAKNIVDTKYDTGFDDKGELVFFEKGTQKRATIKKEGKEDFLRADDVLKNELKALSLWVESNGQGQQQPTTTTTKGSQAEPSGRFKELLEKAQQAA